MSQDTLNGINSIVDDVKGFANDSVRFLRKCNKPDKKGKGWLEREICLSEYLKIASSCAIGFAVMGLVGYVIKLVFIPINNIILSQN
jgi:protein transport protein SEC61 subunit gamma-like protein